ncbi:MAG: hypothetical protein WC747_01655 [Candidatus Babeliales bacterium]|jgi:hypothetical protein
MKSAKIILISCFFVSSALLIAPPKEIEEVSMAQRLNAYNQAYEAVRCGYVKELERVLQTREEDGLIKAEDDFKLRKRELADKYPDVVRSL